VNDLIRRFQQDGDERAAERLMVQFDWVAVNCARRMHRRGESLEDLEQIAREGLLGAVSRFDVGRGVAFKSFAWSTVVGVLRHHYRSRWQVHVSRGLQELHLAAVRAHQELTATNRRSPTIDELAEHLRADRDDVILALDAGQAYRPDSLDRACRADDTRRSVPHERALGAWDDAVEAAADRADLHQLIAALPVRQRIILMMRFFEDRTQREIGQILGLSQVHVSRLELLLIAAILQVANTIRMAAFARRKEIGIMRLVGASNLYISLPFLMETLVAALVGIGLSALTLLAFMYFVIYGKLRPSSNIVEWVDWQDAYVAIAGIAILGFLLTLFPTLVMTRKYLKV
jgi:RNA polymerase sigma factor (sigma-70 family)